MPIRRGAQVPAENERHCIRQTAAIVLATPPWLAAVICCSTTFPASARPCWHARSRSAGRGGSRPACTPDLLPSTLPAFRFSTSPSARSIHAGPVFTTFLIVRRDSSRAPRTQSSLWNELGEAKVSVDGVARSLPAVFHVIRHQNPIEFHGTYPLPGSPARSFLHADPARLPESLSGAEDPRDHNAAVTRSIRLPRASLRKSKCCEGRRRVEVAPEVAGYAWNSSMARGRTGLSLGASPPACCAGERGTRARALSGQGYVTPETVKGLRRRCFAHRVVPETLRSRVPPTAPPRGSSRKFSVRCASDRFFVSSRSMSATRVSAPRCRRSPA